MRANRGGLLMRGVLLESLVMMQGLKRYPEERYSQLTVTFPHVPSPWIHLPIKTRLHQAKQLMNTNQHWLGYFFLGGQRTLFSPCLARFDPLDSHYQAWTGAYLIWNSENNRCVGFEDGEPVLEELATIGVGDQTAWLRSFGDPNPVVQITRADPLNPQDFHSHAKTAFLGEMMTHSDVSPQGPRDWRYQIIFGKPPRDVFELVKPHHEVLLRGYYVAWPIPKFNATIIIYGAAVARAEMRDGRIISYWNRLKHEFKHVIRNVRVHSFRLLHKKSSDLQ